MNISDLHALLCRGTGAAMAILSICVLYGCAPKEAPPVTTAPPAGANLPVPQMAAINAQKRAALERRLADVQGNTTLPAEMKTQTINDLKKQLAELPPK